MKSPIELASALQYGIRKVIDDEIEELVNEMKPQIIERVKGKIGSIAARVTNELSIERMGSDIIIRVKFEDNNLRGLDKK